MEVQRARRARIHLAGEMDLEGIDVRFHPRLGHQLRGLDFLVSQFTESGSQGRVERAPGPGGFPLSRVGHAGAERYSVFLNDPKTETLARGGPGRLRLRQ